MICSCIFYLNSWQDSAMNMKQSLFPQHLCCNLTTLSTVGQGLSMPSTENFHLPWNTKSYSSMKLWPSLLGPNMECHWLWNLREQTRISCCRFWTMQWLPSSASFLLLLPRHSDHCCTKLDVGDSIEKFRPTQTTKWNYSNILAAYLKASRVHNFIDKYFGVVEWIFWDLF